MMEKVPYVVGTAGAITSGTGIGIAYQTALKYLAGNGEPNYTSWCGFVHWILMVGQLYVYTI